MDQNLKIKAFAGLGMLLLALAVVLFVSAGTLNYWEAWLFLFVLSAVTTLNILNLVKNDPALLERRLKAGPTAETRVTQKIIMLCVSALFIAMFIVSGIDRRLAWSQLPTAVILLGDCLIGLAFVVYHFVFRENTFAAGTVEIAAGQKVISTGPYHLVRHPMYSGGLLFLLGIPFALGSLWAVLIFVPLVPALIWRIVDEERLLKEHLPGYIEYCSKVKYRLIPGIY